MTITPSHRAEIMEEFGLTTALTEAEFWPIRDQIKAAIDDDDRRAGRFVDDGTGDIERTEPIPQEHSTLLDEGPRGDDGDDTDTLSAIQRLVDEKLRDKLRYRAALRAHAGGSDDDIGILAQRSPAAHQSAVNDALRNPAAAPGVPNYAGADHPLREVLRSVARIRDGHDGPNGANMIDPINNPLALYTRQQPGPTREEQLRRFMIEEIERNPFYFSHLVNHPQHGYMGNRLIVARTAEEAQTLSIACETACRFAANTRLEDHSRRRFVRMLRSEWGDLDALRLSGDPATAADRWHANIRRQSAAARHPWADSDGVLLPPSGTARDASKLRAAFARGDLMSLHVAFADLDTGSATTLIERLDGHLDHYEFTHATIVAGIGRGAPEAARTAALQQWAERKGVKLTILDPATQAGHDARRLVEAKPDILVTLGTKPAIYDQFLRGTNIPLIESITGTAKAAKQKPYTVYVTGWGFGADSRNERNPDDVERERATVIQHLDHLKEIGAVSRIVHTGGPGVAQIAAGWAAQNGVTCVLDHGVTRETRATLMQFAEGFMKPGPRDLDPETGRRATQPVKRSARDGISNAELLSGLIADNIGATEIERIALEEQARNAPTAIGTRFVTLRRDLRNIERYRPELIACFGTSRSTLDLARVCAAQGLVHAKIKAATSRSDYEQFVSFTTPELADAEALLRSRSFREIVIDGRPTDRTDASGRRIDFSPLTLFGQCDIEHNGTTYRTIAHAIADAATGYAITDQISRLSPMAAQDAAHDHGFTADPDTLISLARTLVRQRFADPAHDDTRLLLSTGGLPITHRNGWGDTVMGVDHDGNGQDLLGHMLMRIRAEHRGRLIAASNELVATSPHGRYHLTRQDASTGTGWLGFMPADGKKGVLLIEQKGGLDPNDAVVLETLATHSAEVRKATRTAFRTRFNQERRQLATA